MRGHILLYFRAVWQVHAPVTWRTDVSLNKVIRPFVRIRLDRPDPKAAEQLQVKPSGVSDAGQALIGECGPRPTSVRADRKRLLIRVAIGFLLPGPIVIALHPVIVRGQFWLQCANGVAHESPEGSVIALIVIFFCAVLIHLRFPLVRYPDRPL
jgi:hypothetical protein